VLEDARRWGLADRVRVAGFVADADLPRYLTAADICACLRWPTNRETSASWLRCLAARRATIVSDLTHMGDLPVLDPRGWRVLDVGYPAREPVAVCIDLLDEEHSLQLALERLARDSGLRERLGRSGRSWWEAHHRLDAMAEAYDRLLREAMQSPPPQATLPAHLTNAGADRLRELMENLGVADRAAHLFEHR
jgi:glycosyltransferase involved in cell wall biosynthesis